MATNQFDEHSDPTRGGPPPRTRAVARSWHPVTLLLLLPIVLSLLTPLYNRAEPKLFSFPAFYWMQLGLVIVGVVSTTIVYQVTKDRGDGE
jgi:hypothetical protein